MRPELDELVIGNLPPHDLEAEHRLLGELMLNPAQLEDLADLEGAHFHETLNAIVFTLIQSLVDRGLKVNVAELYKAAGYDAQVSRKAEYCLQLCTGASVTPYASRLIELAAERTRQRAVMEAANSVVRERSDALTALQIASEKVSRLERRQEKKSTAQRVLERLTDPSPAVIYWTGLPKLDTILNGFRPGHLNLVGARPHVGKTSLLLTILLHMARQKLRVGFVSLEQPHEEIGMRATAWLSGVPFTRIESKQLLREEHELVLEALDELEALRAYLEILDLQDVEGLHKYSEIEAQFRRWARDGVQVAAVDYGQLISVEKNTGPRDDLRYQEIFHGLKRLAVQTGLSVVAASQINRAGDDRPLLRNLHGGGSIEMAVDKAILLHHDREWPRHLRLADVAKNKNGPGGEVYLHLDGPIMRFEETDELPPEPKGKAKPWD